MGDSPSPHPLPAGGERASKAAGEARAAPDNGIIVHSLADARAALAAAHEIGVPVTLASAEAAGAYAGPAWFKAIVDLAVADFPDVTVATILDCGAEAGAALAALRAGFRRIRFDGHPEAAARLVEIAMQQGAVIERERLPGALDLIDCPDPAAACRRFLIGNA